MIFHFVTRHFPLLLPSQSQKMSLVVVVIVVRLSDSVRCESVALAKKCLLERRRIRSACEAAFRPEEATRDRSPSSQVATQSHVPQQQRSPLASVTTTSAAATTSSSSAAAAAAAVTATSSNGESGHVATSTSPIMVGTNSTASTVVTGNLSSSASQKLYHDIMDMVTYFDAWQKMEQLDQQWKQQQQQQQQVPATAGMEMNTSKSKKEVAETLDANDPYSELYNIDQLIDYVKKHLK